MATLPVPQSTGRASVSRSPSPVAHRPPSRSPHPYRRKQDARRAALKSSPFDYSPQASRPATPFRSESGTEADDEQTRRLLAPPNRRKRSSEDDTYDGDEDGERGRRRKRSDVASEAQRRLRFAVARRLLEVVVAGILIVVVLIGREQRAWREVLVRRKEMLFWTIPYMTVILAYPIRILLRSGALWLPKSLDPSPLIYPTLYPIIVALALNPKDRKTANPYLLSNLIISLSNLPPLLTYSWDAHWLLSLCPLIPLAQNATSEPISNSLSLIAPINTTLTSALTTLLYPSLTYSELRLLSSALINLLFNAQSPQAIILQAMIWGGGIGVFLLCEDTIRWNISLARIPTHRFRRAGNTIIGIGRVRRRLRELGSLSSEQQASDSEAEIVALKQSAVRAIPRSFFATLSPRGVAIRKVTYATAVYVTVLAIIFFALRPYIGRYALGGVDPFIWAPGYILCGQTWYQNLVDWINPGVGYCVTEGSTRTAVLRAHLAIYWVAIIAAGLSIVTVLAPKIEVDTRRKVFHGMIIPMFLIPGLFDPTFTHLCLSVALALFILVDLVRAGQLPPASQWIARFLQPYVDGRDLKGPMVVSHVFLLIGAGIGWWLTMAAYRQDDWEWHDKPLELSFTSGVVCVGFGDAAASLIGRRIGKTKWGWRGGKSIEGSLAFVVAVVVGLAIPRLWIVGLNGDWSAGVWGKLLAVAGWGSLVEATASGVNDNVVVPVGVWAMVRGLGL